MKVESIKIKAKRSKIGGRLVTIVDRADLLKRRRELKRILSKPRIPTDDRGLANLNETEREKHQVMLKLIELLLVSVRG